MVSYQFECVKDVGGKWVPFEEHTPIVTAETITAAMNHPDVTQFCETNQCRIYRVVNK